MFNLLGETLTLILPGCLANGIPPILVNIKMLAFMVKPLDNKILFFDKRRIFGDHKTTLGFLGGIAFGTIFGTLLYKTLFPSHADLISIPLVKHSFIMSLGALSGDLVKSFIKRRFSIKSGKSFFPFDQLDYGLGMYLAYAILNPGNNLHFGAVIAVTFSLHLFFTYFGYLAHIRKDPI